MSTHDAIRAHLLERLGVHDCRPTMPSIDELRRTEWSYEFEQLMRNRMVMGALRFDRIGHGDRDYVQLAEQAMSRYNKTDNAEFLVDAANYCLLEFVNDSNPRKHFTPVDRKN
jgi:hypothetical protein